jgi:hypothetical protein
MELKSCEDTLINVIPVITNTAWSAAAGYSRLNIRKSLNVGNLIGCELMTGSPVPGKETASCGEGCECKPKKKFLFHEIRN